MLTSISHDMIKKRQRLSDVHSGYRDGALLELGKD